MRRLPLIAIGPHFISSQEKKQAIGSYANYVDCLAGEGAQAVILTPSVADTKAIARMCDGLLLQGGGDVHPRYFGQKVPKGVKLSLSPEARTEFDLRIIEAFLAAGKPMLGICLGAQTINIALGGDIIQDIPSQCLHARNHRRGRHPVHIHPESRLFEAVGSKKIMTNTYHHQSIGKLGKGLVVSAQSDDGIIEAVESAHRAFILCIQWHPEKEPKTSPSRKIFKTFIESC